MLVLVGVFPFTPYPTTATLLNLWKACWGALPCCFASRALTCAGLWAAGWCLLSRRCRSYVFRRQDCDKGMFHVGLGAFIHTRSALFHPHIRVCGTWCFVSGLFSVSSTLHVVPFVVWPVYGTELWT